MVTPVQVVNWLLRLVVFMVTNLYALFAYVMWSLLLIPLRILAPGLYWKLESVMFKGLQSFVILWMGTHSYNVIESGDDISEVANCEAVLLCNHQSTADTPLVMLALWPHGSCMAQSMWIMDSIFRFTNFGIISLFRNDFFIKQGKETRDQQEGLLADHLSQCYIPQGRQWIILFPEGGFLRNRLEASQSFAKKNGYPVLHHVTLPRIGALRTIISKIGNSSNRAEPSRPLRWVVDMTIGYYNSRGQPPDMLGLCLGTLEKQDLSVHYRVYPLSDIPSGDDDELLSWLYQRYQEKERLLDYFYAHGHFPCDNEERTIPSVPPRRVLYDWVSILLYQVFYLVSSYLHYTYIVRPLISVIF